MSNAERSEEFWSRYSSAGRTGHGGPHEPGREGDRPGGGGESAESPGESPRCLEWCPICRGAERLEDALPPELAEQFRTLQQDALLLARAAIDARLARFEAGRDAQGPQDRTREAGHSGFEDIPID